jgi:hypothetical protein
MRRALAPLAVVAAVAALAAAAVAARPAEDRSSAATQSGLQGTVYRGPILPVCRVGKPCEAAAPGVTLTFSRADVRVMRTKTGSDGTYHVLLPPGVYAVSADMRGPGRAQMPVPHRAKVRSGHIDKLDFRIDTGIR